MKLQHQIYLFLSIGVFLVLALTSIHLPDPTGMAIVQDYTANDRDGNTYAKVLHDQVATFFGIQGIYFPQHACTDVAMSMYNDVAYRPVDEHAGFQSAGNERIASINFVIDRLRRYGTIDLIKGQQLLEKFDTNSMISLNMEAIVRVPKEDRTNFYSMDLFGNTVQGNLYIQRGRFSTPSFDCAFVQYNGNIACNCDAHPIRGIEVAGITGFAPDKDYYGEVIAKIRALEQQ